MQHNPAYHVDGYEVPAAFRVALKHIEECNQWARDVGVTVDDLAEFLIFPRRRAGTGVTSRRLRVRLPSECSHSVVGTGAKLTPAQASSTLRAPGPLVTFLEL